MRKSQDKWRNYFLCNMVFPAQYFSSPTIKSNGGYANRVFNTLQHFPYRDVGGSKKTMGTIELSTNQIKVFIFTGSLV